MRQIICLALCSFWVTIPLTAQEITAGMPVRTAVQSLHGIATDLTPRLELRLGPRGEVPKELCWELKEYDLVVWLYPADNGSISKLGFWTKKDFNQPKAERYELERLAKRISFNPANHTFKVEPVSERSSPQSRNTTRGVKPPTKDERQRRALPDQLR